MVLQKTGAVEETRDADFDLLAAEFEKRARATERLAADIKKYGEAVQALAGHQEELFKYFFEIANRKKSDEEEEGEKEEKARALLDGMHTSQQALTSQATDLFQSSVILDKVIRVNRSMAAKITKRAHKLLDYDRHRRTVEKSNATATQRTRSLDEERKLAKTEGAALDAQVEYEKYNQQLKADIPRYLLLTGRLLQPVIAALIRFQRTFYQEQWQVFSSLDTVASRGITSGRSCAEILSRYEEAVGTALVGLSDIPMIQMASGRVRKIPSKDKDHQSPLEEEMVVVQSPRDVPLRSLAPKMEKLPAESKSTTRAGGRVAKLASHLTAVHLSAPSRPIISSFSPSSTSPSAAPPLPTKKKFVKALYDFSGMQSGDLSFETGDVIEVVKRTETKDDWWTGRLGDVTGSFPANYVTEYP